jgi:hypothetical protein
VQSSKQNGTTALANAWTTHSVSPGEPGTSPPNMCGRSRPQWPPGCQAGVLPLCGLRFCSLQMVGLRESPAGTHCIVSVRTPRCLPRLDSRGVQRDSRICGRLDSTLSHFMCTKSWLQYTVRTAVVWRGTWFGVCPINLIWTNKKGYPFWLVGRAAVPCVLVLLGATWGGGYE